MSNEKKAIYAVLVLAIGVCVYCLLAFLPPFTHNTTFWVGFWFGIVSIVSTTITIAYSLRGTRKNRFLGFPIVYIAFVYMVIQLLLGLLFMAVSIVPTTFAVIISIVVTGAFLTLFFTSDLTRDYVNRFDDQSVENKLFVRALKASVIDLQAQNSNADIAKLLDELMDTVKYSDPMSVEAIKDIESDIERELGSLASFVCSDDIQKTSGSIAKIEGMLKQRNEKLKLLK